MDWTTSRFVVAGTIGDNDSFWAAFLGLHVIEFLFFV